MIPILMIISLQAQEVITIYSAGNSFNPADVTVNQGSIVRFDVGAGHPVLQVSEATWNANGTTPLPEGFSFSDGTGDYQANIPGTIYYVCTFHVNFGMKGTINVLDVTGIEDFQDSFDNNLYPVPAKIFITYFTKSISPIEEIRILDIAGRNMMTLPKPPILDGQVTIDIEHLRTGAYFIIVKSADRIISLKFLKS